MDTDQESYEGPTSSQFGVIWINLTKVKPDFDARLYAFKDLGDLVRSLPKVLEIEEWVPAGATERA